MSNKDKISNSKFIRKVENFTKNFIINITFIVKNKQKIQMQKFNNNKKFN